MMMCRVLSSICHIFSSASVGILCFALLCSYSFPFFHGLGGQGAFLACTIRSVEEWKGVIHVTFNDYIPTLGENSLGWNISTSVVSSSIPR